MVLFLCESVYQLFNAINIKIQLLADEVADLMLTESTDFSRFISSLYESKLFREIYLSPQSVTKNVAFKGMSEQAKKQLMRTPEKFIYDIECLKNCYTDMYIAVDNNIYTKLLYYSMVKKGCKPTLHLYEDGIATYINNISLNVGSDFLRHELYNNNDRFDKNIIEILLYEPELCCSSNAGIPINQLPKIYPNDSKIKRVLLDIFGANSLPQEKYIFLEEAFVKDRRNSLDVQLLDYIAQMVGKENIVIKIHPRNDINRFTDRGFKVIGESLIPWEMTMLESDISEKVFITISSSAAISASLVMGKPCNSIMLYTLMKLSQAPHVRHSNFKSYYAKLNQLLNAEKRYLFTPNTIEELKITLNYIEGRMLQYE